MHVRYNKPSRYSPPRLSDGELSSPSTRNIYLIRPCTMRPLMGEDMTNISHEEKDWIMHIKIWSHQEVVSQGANWKQPSNQREKGYSRHDKGKAIYTSQESDMIIKVEHILVLVWYLVKDIYYIQFQLRMAQ